MAEVWTPCWEVTECKGWLIIWRGQHSFGVRQLTCAELVTFEGRPRPQDRPISRMWGHDLGLMSADYCYFPS